MATFAQYSATYMPEIAALLTVGFPATIHATRFKAGENPVYQFVFSQANVENPKLTPRNLVERYTRGKMLANDPFALAYAVCEERKKFITMIKQGGAWGRTMEFPHKLVQGATYIGGATAGGVVKTPHMHKAIAIHMMGWRLLKIEGNQQDRHMFWFERISLDGADLVPLLQALNTGELATQNTNHPLVVMVTALHNFNMAMGSMDEAKTLNYIRKGLRMVWYHETESKQKKSRIANYLDGGSIR
jgi:hypothetical protein